MRLRILGPVEMVDPDGNPMAVRRRARALLGVLSLRANTALPVNWIIDTLWGERPPPSAASNLRTHVADLRRSLPSGWIESGRGGYRLAVEPGELDMLAFDELAAEGLLCLAAGDNEPAAERLARASGLWRGPVLDGAAVPDVLRPIVERLDDRRVDVIEGCVQARLELGQHGPLAAELRTLVGRYPLRERFWEQLMLALYRCGRQAEAIDVHRRLRRLLDDELGVEPGQPVRELYLRIVRADPSLRIAAPGVRAAAAGWSGVGGSGVGGLGVGGSGVGAAPPQVPRQLPPDVTTFVGRSAYLGLLDATAATGAGVTAVVITAISGTAGVGKTALAVHWAHRGRERFPDGCLYVDLRGYGPEQPLPPAAALAGFLRSLGVAEQPHELAELSARYRTLLADRRLLVVLDNARSADQVRPLLPGTVGCMVLVTSRDDLGGLVARDGARRVELDLMPAAEAVELLRGLIGRRVDTEQDAALALVRCCAGLPLALRIAADLAARRPGRALSDLVDELTRRHLDVLDTGDDPHTAVRAVFDWSYETLTPAAARAFRLLALHPGRDLDVHSAAALTGTDLDEAHRLVDRLLRANLLQRRGADRFGMHDLLRAYATDRLGEPDRDALTRLFDFYAHAVATAETHFSLSHSALRPAPRASSTPPPPLADLGHAKRWLDAERSNLVAVIGYCARHGWPAHACELSQALRLYLDSDSHLRDAVTIHQHALGCARRMGDQAAEAAALTSLGAAEQDLGHHAEAAALLERSLTIRQELGDRHGEVRTAAALAAVLSLLGRHHDAVDRLRRCLVIFRELGDTGGEATATANLGFVYDRLGRYHGSIACHERALAILREFDDRQLESFQLNNLASAYARLGRHREAVDHSQRALLISIDLGDRLSEGYICGHLGAFHTSLGDHRLAHDYLRRALALHREFGAVAAEAVVLVYQGNLLLRLGRHSDALTAYQLALDHDRRLGDRYQEIQALNGMGAALLSLNRHESARRHYESALTLARDAPHPHEEAAALDGLAHVSRALGDLAAAIPRWQAALALYTALDVPEAAQVSHHLATATSQRPVTSSQGPLAQWQSC